MTNSKRQSEVLGDLGKVSRHPEVTRAQAYIREQGEEIATLQKQTAHLTRERDAVVATLRNFSEMRRLLSEASRHEFEAHIAALEEALRSMVTVYVGVIKDHFDQTTYTHVLEEPPVKRARILLGLEPAPAEQKGVEPG